MRPDSPTPEVAGSILVVPTEDADCEGDDDESEPAEDRGLAVLRAPAAHAPGEVGGMLDSSGGSTRLSGVLGSSGSR